MSFGPVFIAVVIAMEGVVGVWGFFLHASGNLRGPSIHMFNNFIYGAAPLAPLLFPNLMLLALIGIWQLRLKFSGPRDNARFTSQTP